MRCKTALKWLELVRPGELSSAQEMKLQAHLRQCPDCRSQREKADSAADLFEKARKEAPHLPDPDVLTDRIMERVERETLAGFKCPDRIPRFFQSPFLRFSLGFAVLLLIGVFLFQSLELARRLERLEKKIAVSVFPPGGRISDFSRSDLLDIAERLTLQVKPPAKADQQISIDWNTFRQWIQLFRKLDDPEARFLLEQLQRMPGFSENNWRKGLRGREWKELMEKKSRKNSSGFFQYDKEDI